jgi:hypothetical protein
MEIDPHVAELLLRWQELRQQGHNVTATELCADCPELAGELQRRLETVDYWEQFLGSRDEEEAASATPASFGKYRVERILGAGGQASTLLAVDPDLRCHVVLKLYHRARTEAEQEQVLREGQALERVRSPYVARCRGVERQGGVPALVLEYIPGRDLKKQQQAWPLGIGQALELTGQLAGGLAAVHACGLLHRDLKPDNVLVGEDGRPRLVDFGLAAPVASADLARISGTLPYMAPEQARGQAERIDPRTDVYGLGAVLYELLTGRPPYQGASREELWRAACAGDVVPPRQVNRRVPRAVNGLCLRCLAKDPAERFASAEELAEAVRRWQKWGRRLSMAVRLAPVALVALLALPLALALALWWPGRGAKDHLQVAFKDGGDHRDGKPVVVEPTPVKKDHRVRDVSLSGGRLRSGAQEAVHAPPDAVFAVERDMILPPGVVCTFEVKEGNEFMQGRAVRLGIQVFPQEKRSEPLPVALEAVEVNGDSISLRDVRTSRGADGIKVERLPVTVRARENTLRIRLKNEGKAPLPITAAVSWSDDPKAVTLHVLAVGVSVYKDPELRLNSADKDAVDLARALQMFGKDLFSKVVIHGLGGAEAALTNAEATRENVINALHALKGQVQEHDLLVVLFSGHGARAEDGNYYFLPHDYNPKRALEATAVGWDVIKEPLEGMPCRVVVILDTSHSGAGMRAGPDLRPELDAAVQKALSQFAGARRGIILLAACLGDQKTPDDFWGHGVLSLALLEGVQEKLLAPRDAGTPPLPRERHPNNPVITLEDLQEYASARVRNLVRLKSLQGDEAVILRPLGDITPQQIPLALFSPGR